VSTWQIGGHVNTSERAISMVRRRRRRHSAGFKAEAVAACLQPGVSIAAVALSRGLNANLLRRWVVEAERTGALPVSREPKRNMKRRIAASLTSLLWGLFTYIGYDLISGVARRHVPGYPNSGQWHYYVYFPLIMLLVSVGLSLLARRMPVPLFVTIWLLQLFIILPFLLGMVAECRGARSAHMTESAPHTLLSGRGWPKKQCVMARRLSKTGRNESCDGRY
jgi:hypothetical protein